MILYVVMGERDGRAWPSAVFKTVGEACQYIESKHGKTFYSYTPVKLESP